MSIIGSVREAFGEPDRPRGLGNGLPVVVNGNAEDTPYGMAALADECSRLAGMAPRTGRNSTLNKSLFRMMQLVGSGHLTEPTVRDNLIAAAQASGLEQHRIDTVMRSGGDPGAENGAIATGKANPRNVTPIDRKATSCSPPSPNSAADSGATTDSSTHGAQSSAADVAEPSDYTDDDPGHTSWWFRDVDAVIDGTASEPGPAHLTRDDEAALFYAGKVNGLIGESESGKTWVALLAVQQALHVGERVLYLDFEDSASGIIGRLRALGATPGELARLAYVDPDETLHIAAKADLAAVLDTHQPGLIVLDGFNAAMTLLGLDLQSNKDATTFAQALLKPLSRTSATVVYIDHLPKNKEAQGKGGIGAQAKRAMTTGCALRVDVVQEFGRGMTGRLKLTVDKDRAGHVRAISAGAKIAGQAVLVSAADGSSVDLYIEAPDLRPASERGPWRPTHLMEKVSRFLETVSGGASGRDVTNNVQGKAEHLRAALDALVEDGWVERETGAHRALIHRSIRPYREGDVPSASSASPVRPSASQDAPELVRPASPTLGGDADALGDGGEEPDPVRPEDDDPDDPWWNR